MRKNNEKKPPEWAALGIVVKREKLCKKNNALLVLGNQPCVTPFHLP